MSIEVTCVICGKKYQLDEKYAGRSGSCKQCGTAFVVPQAAARRHTLTVQQEAAVQADPAIPPTAAVHQEFGATTAAGNWGAAPGTSPAISGLAITSMVVGCAAVLVCCVPVVPGIVALVFGLIALKKIAADGTGGKGLAIAGIATGSVSIVTSTLFCGLFLAPPVMVARAAANRARETANRVKCASQMKHIGVALQSYASSHGGQFPNRLEDLLLNQSVSPDVFICPDSNDTAAPGSTPAAQAAALSTGGHLSYVYVPGLNLRSNPQSVLLYEPITNHTDGCNVLFADGHVEFLNAAAGAILIAELQAGHNPPGTSPQTPAPVSRTPRSARQGSNPIATPSSPPAPVWADHSKLPPGAKKTGAVGNARDGRLIYADIDPVVGFRAVLSQPDQWNKQSILIQVDPIYDRETPSETASTLVMAKDGYVVSGLIVAGKEHSHAMRVIFARLKKNGTVDAGDTYQSDWLGDPQTEMQTQLAGKGEMVVGIWGSKGMFLDGLGLIVMPAK